MSETEQTEYDKAFADLEKAAKPAGETPPESEIEPSSPEPSGETPPSADSDAVAAAAYQRETAALQTRLASTEKALKDTQSWGRGIAQRLSDLQKSVQEARLKGERPALLDDMDGLETAIRHVLKKDEPEGDDWIEPPAAPEPTPKASGASWDQQVAEALPDLNELLNDPELMAAANAARARVGAAWSNPAVAIAQLSAVRERFMLSRENRESRRLQGMTLPSGGQGSKPRTTQKSQDELASEVWNESPEEFRKRKARTIGLM